MEVGEVLRTGGGVLEGGHGQHLALFHDVSVRGELVPRASPCPPLVTCCPARAPPPPMFQPAKGRRDTEGHVLTRRSLSRSTWWSPFFRPPSSPSSTRKSLGERASPSPSMLCCRSSSSHCPAGVSSPLSPSCPRTNTRSGISLTTSPAPGARLVDAQEHSRAGWCTVVHDPLLNVSGARRSAPKCQQGRTTLVFESIPQAETTQLCALKSIPQHSPQGSSETRAPCDRCRTHDYRNLIARHWKGCWRCCVPHAVHGLVEPRLVPRSSRSSSLGLACGTLGEEDVCLPVKSVPDDGLPPKLGLCVVRRWPEVLEVLQGAAESQRQVVSAH